MNGVSYSVVGPPVFSRNDSQSRTTPVRTENKARHSGRALLRVQVAVLVAGALLIGVVAFADQAQADECIRIAADDLAVGNDCGGICSVDVTILRVGLVRSGGTTRMMVRGGKRR